MNTTKPTVLIVVPNYLPAYKAGGPLRSIKRIVECLSDDFSFFILTSDKDGDGSKLEGVPKDVWNKVDCNTFVYYSSEVLSRKVFFDIKYDIKPGFIYVNGFFSRFSISLQLKLALFRWKVPVLIAPRGDLLPGPLRIKRFKKMFYIAFYKIFKLHKRIFWHATDDQEVSAIKHLFGDSSITYKSQNIPQRPPKTIWFDKPEKVPGAVRLVYLSKISKKKRLDLLISALKYIDAEVILNIYGDGEELDYGIYCKSLARCLPDNISIHFHGPVTQDEAWVALRSSHVFVLLSEGENFSHSIVESLSVGTPVLISKYTPWSDVEVSGAGQVVAELTEDNIIKALGYFERLSNDDYTYCSKASLAYVDNSQVLSSCRDDTKNMFNNMSPK